MQSGFSAVGLVAFSGILSWIVGGWSQVGEVMPLLKSMVMLVVREGR